MIDRKIFCKSGQWSRGLVWASKPNVSARSQSQNVGLDFDLDSGGQNVGLGWSRGQHIGLGLISRVSSWSQFPSPEFGAGLENFASFNSIACTVRNSKS